MKKLLALFGTLCILLFAANSWAQVSGSKHDFSAEGWSEGKICLPCHTPHNSDTTVSNAPLWNHEVTSATFNLYSGLGTLNATDTGQPDGVSKLCLSCHDGTIALDSFGGATGSNTLSGTALVGTDLSNDHPISFTYDTALSIADGELHNPATKTSGLGGTIQADMLFNDKLECGSCHDVHNGSGGNPNLLRIDNAGSQLCLTCHNK